jgi:broad specificity phosphatase PhoE
MRSIYVLRHSARDSGAAHLNAAGVALAREFGNVLGPMQVVAVSPALRCIETAVALGYAIDAEWDELALPEDEGLMHELDRATTYADAAWLAAHGRHVPAYAAQLRRRIIGAAADLHDHQDALLLTHGGIVEVIAAAVVGAEVGELPGGVGYCEGVRMMLHTDGELQYRAGEVTGRWSVQRLCS